MSMLSLERRLCRNFGKQVMTVSTLAQLTKSQSFTEKLDLDPVIPSRDEAFNIDESLSEQTLNFTRKRTLLSGAFAFTRPQERKEYKFMLASDAALAELGLDRSELSNPEFQRVVSGQDYKSSGFFPYSQAYAGWQFGDFAGQLGDGRVVNLFEVTNDQGKRYELQLKGAGLTPFSRFADGKAVLRSSIREFIISESLHLVGIPSTRALAITLLPQTRAMRSGMEQCAVVCRMAESWVRIGTFDLYRLRNDRSGIRKLADYCISEVFHNELSEVPDFPEKLGVMTRYDQLYLEIVKRNALTVAKWQAYGFLNGVLNTDNTSILGLSIDFGPFAYMDRFDPDYTSNHDDHHRRYSFRETPNSIFWNLARLGEDMVELIGSGSELIDDPKFISNGVPLDKQEFVLNRCTEVVTYAHDLYQETFLENYYKLLSQRLGLTEHLKEDIDKVHASLLTTLRILKLDYNNFYAILQSLELHLDSDFESLAKKFIPENFKEGGLNTITKDEIVEELSPWLQKFLERLESANISNEQRYEIASQVNPRFLPRNWILQEVIDYTEDNDGDVKYLNKLLKMSINPYGPLKWGDEEKELEAHWMGGSNDEKLLMSKCSCSS